MACERKLLESEATTGFFVLLGTKGKKETLEWCMKANFIAARYECPRCKKEMRLPERKGTVDGYEWRGVKGQFDSYVVEYMWRRSNGHKLVDDNFHEFLASIARVYLPTEHDEMQA
ncbi:hypothetical protein TNCV_4850231 [Trichonephila clavipes]|nr:hypothetical protein TNCV_4850231 [Trichonephila clavipes]